MPVEITGGSDAAAMALFDPAALPPDFDAKMKEDPERLFTEMRQRGLALAMDCDADGDYPAHLYVNEALPEAHRAYLINPIVVERFAVPSGNLHWTGIEFAYQKDDSFLRKYPQMGCLRPIAPGDYHVTAWETMFPQEKLDAAIQAAVSPAQRALYRWHGRLAALAMAALLVAIVAFFKLDSRTWCLFALPPAALVIALPILIDRLPLYRAAHKGVRAAESQFPSIIIEMKKIA